MEEFDWANHERELDRILFKDFPLIRRGSEDHRNFWKFLNRYQRFNAKHSKFGTVTTTSDGGVSKDDSPFSSFPKHYDKSYRISFSVMTDDLAYRLRQIQQRREDEGRRKSLLTNEHLTYVRTALRHFINFLQKKKFEKIVKIRQDQLNLPIYQFKQHILSAIDRHQVVLIAGDTGCGKSTQVPQYLLSAGHHQIACTQPRRIACLSLAKRVGYETLSEYGTHIAYQVRFEGSKTMATKVLFLTEGLLLRQLSTDPALSWYNILIVDEVHERHVHGDFLMGVLRLLTDRRSDLKLILMSATINIQLFSEYFQGAPVIRVPGRLYPIDLQYNPISNQQFLTQKSQRLDPKPYLRIMQQIDSTYINNERGDLLIFVSGMNEITTLLQEAKAYAQNTNTWIILPLHSALSIEEQDRVFDVAPDGVRKCIISTNIAETSITIDGIRFVIDSGKVKEMGYDSTSKMSRLQEFWISKASAEQRKGRAGRTGPGICYRMYGELDYESFNDYSTPEIQRVPLESLVLQAADLKLGNIRKFPFIEPPSAASIENSISFLKEQGALFSNESLTPIGTMLAKLPVDVVIGKMLIMGSLFHVIEPVLIIAAGLSVQSPFTKSSFGQDEASSHTIRQPLESEHGDPFTLLNAFDQWIEVKSEGVKASSSWCRRRGIEQQRFYEMVKLREQFRQVLEDHGLLAEDRYDEELVGGVRGHGKGSRWSRLSGNQQKELKDMRKRQRMENKKKKVLKMDSEGGAQSDSDSEMVSTSADLKHLEFKLLHDVTQLQESSSTRRAYTLKDINLLKVVISSGLYPHIAIADESNSSRKGSELVFHTKSKGFVVVHPTSVFVTNPEYLMKEGSDDVQKKRPQLLAYEKLLETNRPYIVNGLRVPALQTLLLCSQDIDTDGDCKRFIVDQWLEICINDITAGQEMISIVQLLRSTWIKLLELKLEAKEKEKEAKMVSYKSSSSETFSYDMSDMEDLLGTKLAEFLDTDYKYSLSQILSSTRPHLYKGPAIIETESSTQSEDKLSVSEGKIGAFGKKLLPHSFKGGWCITEYLTYDCLVDASEADAASSVNQHLRRVWVCLNCQETMIVNMAEELSHRGECELLQKQKSLVVGQRGDTVIKANSREYYCQECDKTYNLSSVEILRHKQTHKRIT